MSETSIRPARAEDRDTIHHLERAAFPTAAEADLVDALVAAGDSTLSLVAERDGAIVGHLLCSRMSVEGDGRPILAVGLGPVAVRPEYQGQGIGGALIAEALARSREAGEEMMFVLGDPAYYGRSGFTAHAARPFASPYAGEYFMAARLVDIAVPETGLAKYAPAFADLE